MPTKKKAKKVGVDKTRSIKVKKGVRPQPLKMEAKKKAKGDGEGDRGKRVPSASPKKRGGGSSKKTSRSDIVGSELGEQKLKGRASSLSEKREKAPQAVKLGKKSKSSATRSGSGQVVAMEKLGRLAQKWMTLYRRSKNMKAIPYNMRGEYEAKTAIEHKVLGWGYILANKNDRLEVLFKDGVRYLISNYR